MLKLLMKKLGTPDSDPPSVEGSGGVSADGDTAFVLVPAPTFVGCAAGVLLCGWMTTVRGCERCVRTSGAGTVVVCGAVVVVPVVGLVLVVGVEGSGADGGGAGTVVVSGVGAETSGVDTVVAVVVVVSANAPLAGISATSAARSNSVFVSGRRIIAISCRAGS